MRRKLWAAVICLLAMVGMGVNTSAVTLQVEGKRLTQDVSARIINGSTYVPLREITQVLKPEAKISWEQGSAVVSSGNLQLTAAPGKTYIEANGRFLFTKDGVKLEGGRTLVPLRALAQALGATVSWDGAAATATVYPGSGTILHGDDFYDADELYWLSRIISSESRGEPLSGKIAVGNVVLNRMRSQEFPNTIYGVIFDDRWGGQFEPVRNASIYAAPTEESIMAAKLVLDGAETAGESLYFLAPALTNNHWMMENRTYVTTIGCHWFYR